ncbi:MAG: hypothetical protein BWY85_01397 [Firmicutes bacterium ADurb.Bin506]|nr:MAG: hypothetical protein BWY85_01397 [Firmicutes bacterium ADurb.Bin506]
MPDLGTECVHDLLKAGEVVRRPGGKADALARAHIDAVVERQLKDFRQVEVACKDVGFLSEGSGLHTATRAALTRVLQRLARPEHLLHDHVGVEDRWLPPAFAHYLQGSLEEPVGVLGRQLDVGARLQQAHVIDGVEHHVGELVYAVVAVRRQPSGVDVGKVSVGATLLGRDSHLWRSGLVVELHPETTEEFHGRLPGELARLDPRSVEGIHVLVESAGVERVPGVELSYHAQVAEPVCLQRLPEITRRVFGHVRTHLCDAH